MPKIGIDAIHFFSSAYYLDLKTLAEKRSIDVSKYNESLGQYKMAIAAPDEDIVTLGANAAFPLLNEENISEIDTLLFATESGIDQSKSAGVFVHDLLKLPKTCRVLELKQACYSATGAIQMALGMIAHQPKRKILIIAADIAKYGLKTPGESSQGCGAIAMLLTQNPKLMAIESGSGIHTESVMDFWRPNYLEEALVNGMYSSKLYMSSLESCWQSYVQNTARTFDDHSFFCYHAPLPRLVEKSHSRLAKQSKKPLDNQEELKKQVEDSLVYGREIGNSYAASLYIGLASLLDKAKSNLDNARVGFYSYGSGLVSEFFSGVIESNYKQHLHSIAHQKMIDERKELSYDEYEDFYLFRLPKDGSALKLPRHQKGLFRLAAVQDHKRIYEKL